mgnify:CR=1 FL=1
MTKVLKIMVALLVSFTLFFAVAQPTMVLAADPSTITGEINNTDSKAQKEMTGIASKVTGFIWVLSIIVAVVVVMYTGLKFIVGSANEKAEYKKTMIPYIIGAVLLFAATTIANAIYTFASGMNSAS